MSRRPGKFTGSKSSIRFRKGQGGSGNVEGQVCLEGQEVMEGQGGLGGSECQMGNKSIPAK